MTGWALGERWIRQYFLSKPSVSMTSWQWNRLHITGTLWGECLFVFQFEILSPMTCWSQQMETFSTLLALCVGNSPVTGEFPSQRPVMWSFDVFLICAWINGWVNNREAGHLRRHRDHYDVIVMSSSVCSSFNTETIKGVKKFVTFHQSSWKWASDLRNTINSLALGDLKQI